MVANTKKKLQENKVINFYSNGETIILNKKMLDRIHSLAP